MSATSDQSELSLDRLEAFSAGAFAIAVTLLVLGWGSSDAGKHRLPSIMHEWPSYPADVTSSFTIGVVWAANTQQSPASVADMEYGEREPDYRMSLAAERTYLAYLRTALALMAAGIGVAGALPDAGGKPLRRTIGVVLVAAGGGSSSPRDAAGSPSITRCAVESHYRQS